jgi:predicted nucleic acid-binding protein
VRLVLDTNVYISAILFDGLPELPVRLARANRITLLTSEPIIAELIGVLRSKLAWPEQQLRDVEKELRECAVDGRADLIISGDRHLLKLGPFAGIRILSPRAFAELLGIRE